jgi:hypothetical protein
MVMLGSGVGPTAGQDLSDALRIAQQQQDDDGGWADKYDDAESTTGSAANPSTGDRSVPPDSGWPRQLSGSGYNVSLYQPQIESWNENQGRLRARAAAAVQSADQGEPFYGAVWLSAHTQVDAQRQQVGLSNIEVTKVNFPSAGTGVDYLALMRGLIPASVQSIALGRLQTNLAINAAKARQPEVKNDPPRILFSTSAAMLVLVDGQPMARPVAGTQLSRVINSKALILRNAAGTYFMYLIDRWLQAPAIEGPWTAMPDPTAEMEQAKQAAAAAQQVNLLNQAGSDARMAVDFGSFPAVYVSTVPAELLQTQGPPLFQPIENTQLQFISNSYDNIFLHSPSQTYYALIAGRWFRSPSLQNGSWQFVSAKSLPADFAAIPPGHVASDVRSSVAGTAEAQTALVDNIVPQTAAIDRHRATLTLTYDGAPQFKPIAGTRLSYAANCPTPVIRKNPYYAAHGGAWFQADSPTGPWTVATAIPEEIYEIPPSAPLYYVTYLVIYDATDDSVFVGYTPGYFGSFVSPDEVVVYGTGWMYEPWLGSYWIGPPLTYGMGAALDWDAVAGFGWGFAGDATVLPWWGPVGWGWSGPWDGRVWSLARYDFYGRWGAALVGDRSPEMIEDRMAGWRSGLYAAEDGRVFRRAATGWEYGADDGWRRSWGGPGLEREAMARWSYDRAAMGGFGGAFRGGLGGRAGGRR